MVNEQVTMTLSSGWRWPSTRKRTLHSHTCKPSAPNRWVGGGAKWLRPPHFAMPTAQMGRLTRRIAP